MKALMHFAGHLGVVVLHGNKGDMCLEEKDGLKFTMGGVNKIHGTQTSTRMGRLKDRTLVRTNGGTESD